MSPFQLQSRPCLPNSATNSPMKAPMYMECKNPCAPQHLFLWQIYLLGIWRAPVGTFKKDYYEIPFWRNCTHWCQSCTCPQSKLRHWICPENTSAPYFTLPRAAGRSHFQLSSKQVHTNCAQQLSYSIMTHFCRRVFHKVGPGWGRHFIECWELMSLTDRGYGIPLSAFLANPMYVNHLIHTYIYIYIYLSHICIQ